VLIDRAIPPSHGHVVIAVVDDEFVCRRLCRKATDIRLQATRAGCADILAREGDRVPDLGCRHPGHQVHAGLSGYPGETMFALVDVNNMYVSCERVFRPSLIGEPWWCCRTTTAPASPAATRPRTWA
jgi:hypothetical protein